MRNNGFAGRSAVGRRIGGKLTSLSNTLNKTVKSATDRVKRVGKTSLDALPKEEDLDNMWWYCQSLIVASRTVFKLVPNILISDVVCTKHL